MVLPRRSRACPEPSTHLMASTMFVLPEPLGPTIAVTPPSKRISVDRAKVLKPNRWSERRNKAAGTVADAGFGSPVGGATPEVLRTDGCEVRALRDRLPAWARAPR